jgi:hypothetical protein
MTVVGTKFLMFAVIFVPIIGLITVALWNALMPRIFGLPAISFWQALGLLLLSRLLFGRLGGWGHRMRKSRFVHGWKDLTPEERQRFRQAMGSHCPPKFGPGEAADNV